MTEFLLAEFSTSHDTFTAARDAAGAGIPAEDVLSPHPIEGIDAYLAPSSHRTPIGWVLVAAGAVGAIGGYGMQWYSSVIDYPILSGGRPLNSWPAFLLVPYETAILSAAVTGLLGWLWMCGLPKLYHPLFASDATERAMQDCYLLVFPRRDELRAKIEHTLKPRAVHEILE